MIKLDRLVFFAGLISNFILIVLSLFTTQSNANFIIKVGDTVLLLTGLAIFVYFLLDKNFKILYYIGYILSQRAISFIFQVGIFKAFTITNPTILLMISIVSGLITSFTSGALYQYFKEMSYRKVDNK